MPSMAGRITHNSLSTRGPPIALLAAYISARAAGHPHMRSAAGGPHAWAAGSPCHPRHTQLDRLQHTAHQAPVYPISTYTAAHTGHSLHGSTQPTRLQYTAHRQQLIHGSTYTTLIHDITTHGVTRRYPKSLIVINRIPHRRVFQFPCCIGFALLLF
ncbi:hypothetical protein M011DRAFT_783 [Sporormia fimetaria CBS 119925]|uniref:Uncharacterized protein n=1 Tax=Sporormia fimetaria CBS 119925 TaxID=1340428 RepID=A0A6A6VPE3_9PLEO|nr:hypothetical protein M011DRAFT_783 [Sporormia fimetaria CBS 119925]